MCCVLPAPSSLAGRRRAGIGGGPVIRTLALAYGKLGSARSTSCVTSEEAFHLSGPPHSSVE